MKHLKTLLAIFTIIFMSPDAHSQNLSARGIDSSESAEVACLAEVERMRGQLSDLQDLKDDIISCNKGGQVFDGSGCVALASLTAGWDPDAENPDFLSFYDKKGHLIAGPIKVERGADGGNKGCPPGYKPKK